MKIASWNVNSLKVRLPHVIEWLDMSKPDVLALQELKLDDPQFPTEALESLGYHLAYAGQRTYNGIALISKHPISDADRVVNLPTFPDEQKRVLAATIECSEDPADWIRVITVYIPNGQSLDSDKFQYKQEWLSHLQVFLKEQLESYQNVILLGDFNIAPDDRDVYDPLAWQGAIHCSDIERAAYQKMLSLGLFDTFRLHEDQAGFYSWWDYRQAAFRRNHGLRIDLILASEAMAKQCVSASIDKSPRKWERPSDHTVVLAEFTA